MMKLQWPGTKFETVLQLSLSIFQYCLCLFLIAFHLNFLSDFVQNRYERQIILIVDPDCMFVRPIDYIIEAGAPIAQVWTCKIISIIYIHILISLRQFFSKHSSAFESLVFPWI